MINDGEDINKTEYDRRNSSRRPIDCLQRERAHDADGHGRRRRAVPSPSAVRTDRRGTANATVQDDARNSPLARSRANDEKTSPENPPTDKTSSSVTGSQRRSKLRACFSRTDFIYESVCWSFPAGTEECFLFPRSKRDLTYVLGTRTVHCPLGPCRQVQLHVYLIRSLEPEKST